LSVSAGKLSLAKFILCVFVPNSLVSLGGSRTIMAGISTLSIAYCACQ